MSPSPDPPEEPLDDGIDVAIVGIGCHLPGAESAEEFWENLRSGTESIRTYSEEELIAAGVSPELLSHPNYVRRGAPLANMESFDADFFGLSPKDAAIMDPQHRHFLECSWEALEDAGHPPERFEGPIGVFGGCGMGAYFAFNILSNQELVDEVGLFLLRHTGNDKDFLSTRVSYTFNLQGPSVNVQTACSTSLVAVHLAVQSLLSRECDMALAGGSTIELPHAQGYLYKENEILSPDGEVRAFDHRSKGTVFGSGAVVVALRRLEDAIADKDRIYAVVRGSAVNNDGGNKGNYLAPDVDGQAKAISEALGVAGVEPDDIGYVECHGTGTPIGDPIEISGLTEAFRQSTDRSGFCAIGSVKGNIGHLDTAAGGASLIKVALALRNAEIPPSLHYDKANPEIDFERTPFFVNAALRPWKVEGDRPRMAGVTSLGVGGTNAHIVLEEPPAAPVSRSETDDELQLYVLSAKSKGALDDGAARIAEHLERRPGDSTADVAWSLLTTRARFAQGRVVAATSRAEAIELLRGNDPRRVFTHSRLSAEPSVVFLLPGGGAQHPGMVRDLYERDAAFRADLERGFDAFMASRGHDLRPLLFPTSDDAATAEKAAAELTRPSLQLPALFIIEHALASAWKRRGVEPDALIGHSLGENTAACIAGVLGYEDALGLISLRGELFERVPRGGMLSISLAADQLRPLLGQDCDLATINGPELCVASGSLAALDELEQRLATRGIEVQHIAIQIAAHSRMLEPILAEFHAHLETLTLSAPKIPFISNVTGDWITTEEATSAKYWTRHLRSTVRFSDGVAKLLEEPGRVLLEVGPGKTLSSLARQQPALRGRGEALPSLRHAEEAVDDRAAFLGAAGRLWALGVPIDLEQLHDASERVTLRLPTYAFQRKRYWIEPGRPKVAESSAPRISKLSRQEDWLFEPVWRRAEPRRRNAGEAPPRWLVFMDSTGVGRRLVNRLRESGSEVVTVSEGDAFNQLGPESFALAPEHGGEGYERLVRELVAHGKTPDRIAHLWLLTDDRSFRPGSSFFHRNQERGFYSLFYLAQGLGSEDRTEGLELFCATNGTVSVHDEGVLHPDKATVFGPTRVIPREYSGFAVTAVDVDLPDRPKGLLARTKTHDAHVERVADDLWRELTAEPGDASETLTAAWRDGQRYALEIERRRAPEALQTLLRDGGSYLITGGLGGIGLAIARSLAERPGTRLTLLARRDLPARDAWTAWLENHGTNDPVSRRIAKVLDLEQAGAKVLVVSADVTNEGQMERAVASAVEVHGELNGVIHAAGVLRDGPIQGRQQNEVEEVFAPKIHGTLVLDQVLSGLDLDFFVAFSSTSVHVAPAGQVDYVAANAFLDAFAKRAKRKGTKRCDLSLAWGLWDEVGMGARAAKAEDAPAERRREVDSRDAQHPAFESLTRLSDGTRQLEGEWSADSVWMLDEHRTARGQALVPGTGFLQLARIALAEIGELGTFAVQDLYFLRALYCAEDSSRRVRVRLQPSDRGFEFSVFGRTALADGRQGYERHAECSLHLRAPEALPKLDVEAIEARCKGRHLGPTPEGIATGQEQHLRFGPRWRVLREVRYGEGEAIARLELPRRFESDLEHYELHPGLLDLATGFAMELIPKYDAAQGLWVPVKYDRAEFHGPLGLHVVAHARLVPASAGAEFASFDLTLARPSGEVLFTASGFTIKHLGAVPDLALAPEPTPAEMELDRTGQSPAEVRLSASERRLRERLAFGIRTEEGTRALMRLLSEGARGQVIVSSMDVDALTEEARLASIEDRPSSGGARFERPSNLSSDFIEPRDEIERTLQGFWQELLGVDQIGVEDSFFDLGGHSLIAVRLFAKVKKTYEVDYPISVLFEAPTIAACADRIREHVGADVGSERSARPERRFTHLVPMHPGQGGSGSKTPFFLVAGMFGNVMNLRHLASLVGADRPFFGLQARGLYGELEPHRTFEEAASDYLEELRTVQPEGPYLLGGFSGGGITAYEMAQQLERDGQEVAALILLDTPLPSRDPITGQDKLRVHLQRIKKAGPAYLTDWVKNRVAWELEQRHAKKHGPQAAEQGKFHNEIIEAAFRSALELYDIQNYSGELVLFRPELPVEYRMPDGRLLNEFREVICEDNGWARKGLVTTDRLEVHEVPGDHDSMVLEPHVRTLAGLLREVLDAAESRLGGASALERTG